MTATETLSILEAAQKLFGLTNDELEKIHPVGPPVLNTCSPLLTSSRHPRARSAYKDTKMP